MHGRNGKYIVNESTGLEITKMLSPALLLHCCALSNPFLWGSRASFRYCDICVTRARTPAVSLADKDLRLEKIHQKRFYGAQTPNGLFLFGNFSFSDRYTWPRHRRFIGLQFCKTIFKNHSAVPFKKKTKGGECTK